MRTAILIAAFLVFSVTAVSANSPPRLKSHLQDTQMVVIVGAKVHLNCPVEGDTSHMLFEWLKDRRSVAGRDGKRLKGANSGTLRIQSAAMDDSGIYTCRVVNGFGSATMNYTLHVEVPHLDPDETSHTQEDNLYPVADVSRSSTYTSRPKFVHITSSENGVIQRPVGSAVRLKCHAIGDPQPQIVWRKNGRQIRDNDLGPDSRRTRYSLRLYGLQEKDSGFYSCLARNAVGSIGANFTLEVIGVIKNKPELSGPDPENVTVAYGGTAVLKCRVQSKAPPHIKWLKQVTEEEREGNMKIQNFIPVDDDLYRVLLNSSEAVEMPDGSFLNKFYINGASERDSGKYICWAANIQGYSYRSAYLIVMPRLRLEVTAVPRDEVRYTVIIVVLLIIAAILIIAVIGLIFSYCCTTSQNPVAAPFKNSDGPHEDGISDTYPKEMYHSCVGRSNLVALTSGALKDRMPSEWHHHRTLLHCEPS